jgi:hypothetical protein
MGTNGVAMLLRKWTWILVAAALVGCDNSDDGDPVVDADRSGAGDATTDTTPDGGGDATGDPDDADAADAGDTGGPDADAADSADDPDAADAADTSDTADATDASDASPDSADTSDATDAADTADTPDSADTADSSDVSDADATDAPDATVELGAVAGSVTEARTGRTVPVAGVVVRAGGRSTTTAADGSFRIDEVPAGDEVVVQVLPTASLGTTWSSSARAVRVDPEFTTEVAFELLAGCQATVDVSAANGVVAPGPCGDPATIAGIELPRDGVVDADGNDVSSVLVELIPMPTATAGVGGGGAFAAFPGDMRAFAADGTPVYLESRGALEVRLWDAVSGAPANLRDGSRAEIVFAASDASLDDGSDVPMWAFDEDSARWVQEPELAAEVHTIDGALVMRVRVPHFTWWNADQVATLACITGRVLDGAGEPLARVEVLSRGLDYLGVSRAPTAEDGTFQVAARRSSAVAVSAALRVGGAEVTVSRQVETLPDIASCVHAGDLALDTDSLAACARGRVIDGGGEPVPDAEVVAFNRGAEFRARSAADGTFCLPVHPDATFDLLASATLDGDASIGRVRGLSGTAGSGYCSDTDAACTEVGDVELTPVGCVAGAVVDEGGPVGGALVTIAGRYQAPAYATTASDGRYCVAAEVGPIDAFALVGGFLAAPSRFASVLDHPGGPSGGDCATPVTCADVNFFLTELNCVSGRVLDPEGAPLPGARVAATDALGGRTRVVYADADARFCVPASAGTDVRIDVDLFERGARFTASTVVSTTNAPGACALDSCTDVGELRTTSFAYETCVTGLLTDPSPLPFNDPVRVGFSTGDVAILPDRTGRFCVDIVASSTLVLEDTVDRGCIGLRSTEIDVSAAEAGPSCRDARDCLDIGEVDFNDFCFFS